MVSNNEKECTKDINKKDDLVFSIAFKKDGESFQSVMEKILLNKINKNE